MLSEGGNMNLYEPKSLIDGRLIGQMPGDLFVAVPDKLSDKPILVSYYGALLEIKDWKKEAIAFKRFKDKFYKEGSGRPEHYTLGYFAFKPDTRVQHV